MAMRGINDLGPMALAIVSLAIIIGIGAIVLAELSSLSVVSNSTTASNTISAGESALGTFSDFFTVIVVVGVAAVIFLLLGALRRAGNNSMA
jgi:type II secretory pathway component PulF